MSVAVASAAGVGGTGALRLLVKSPAPSGSGEPAGPVAAAATEGLRRAAEFERQIETLDQKEMELHQTQARIAREQMQTFIRDLTAVRQEVLALRQWQEKVMSELAASVEVKHAELTAAWKKESLERDAASQTAFAELDRKLALHKKSTEDLITQHGDSLNKVHDAMGKLDFHHGSLSARLEAVSRDVEATVSERMRAVDVSLAELSAAVGLDKKRMEQSLQAHHATLSERVVYLEQALGESADQHQKVLEATHRRLEQLHGQLSEHSGATLAQHATMEQRMAYLEQVLGDSADKHAKELAAAHAKLAEVHGRVADLRKDTALKEEHHASVQERLGYLEQLAGDSAERHAQELATLRAAHDRHVAAVAQHARDLEVLKAAHSEHAAVADRVAYHQEMSVRQAEELASLRLAHERLSGRQTAAEAQAQSLSKSHAALAGEKQALTASHAMLKERLDQLDSLHGDLAQRHTAELEAFRGLHERLAGQSAKLAKDVEGLRAAHSQHGERTAQLERLLGDSADRHGQELAGASAKIDQLHVRLSACEKLGGALDELKRSHGELSRQRDDELRAHHATVEERLRYIEAMLGDSADKHSAELSGLRAAHEKHVESLAKHAKGLEAAHSLHATVQERLAFLEQRVGDSAERHGGELAAAAARLEHLHARVSACEEQAGALGELQGAHAQLRAEKVALDKHHATLAERVAYLEKALGDSADRHAQELEALRAAHGGHAAALGEGLRTAQAHHAAVEERLDYLEKVLGDSADKHARELAAAHARLEHLHGRLGACEAGGVAGLADLRAAHSGLAEQKAALEAHHVSLRERVDFLEGALGDSADKHTQMLEAAHAKLELVQGRLATCERAGQELGDRWAQAQGDSRAALEAHHATVQERLSYVEQLLGDSADKHGKELDLLRAAHDTHLQALSKHAKDVEALRATSMHHASFAERLDYLEELMGDSADKHASELAALHQKTEQLQSRLAEERESREKHHGSIRDLIAKETSQRDVHHASVKDRVAYLESIIGDNADKHAKELEEAKSVANRLALDAKARDTHHSSIAERLEQLEKSHGAAASSAAEELQLLHQKVDKVYSRIATVKSAWRQHTETSSPERQ